MRIIAGTYRGKKLTSFDGMDIRPTSDRVKESLFAILSDRVIGASVLDLFAGSGNLGIECLSRGASFVHFNDLAQSSLNVLKKNLDSVRATNYKISKGDFRACLMGKGEYDLIFIDPPYASEFGVEALRLIAKGKLSERGIAIFENESEGATIEGLELYDTRSYGRTKLHFYRNV